MRKLIALLSAVVLAILGVSVVTSASASPGYPNEITYSGQGLTADGTLEEGSCDEDTAPYLLFVLTANKATAADITLPSGTFPMVQSGNGAYKFMADYQNPDSLIGVAVASYDGAQTKAQFVISHGCAGDSTSTPTPTPTS